MLDQKRGLVLKVWAQDIIFLGFFNFYGSCDWCSEGLDFQISQAIWSRTCHSSNIGRINITSSFERRLALNWSSSCDVAWSITGLRFWTGKEYYLFLGLRICNSLVLFQWLLRPWGRWLFMRILSQCLYIFALTIMKSRTSPLLFQIEIFIFGVLLNLFLFLDNESFCAFGFTSDGLLVVSHQLLRCWTLWPMFLNHRNRDIRELTMGPRVWRKRILPFGLFFDMHDRISSLR